MLQHHVMSGLFITKLFFFKFQDDSTMSNNCRNLLIIHILIDNAGRSGNVSNMTLEEFNARRTHSHDGQQYSYAEVILKRSLTILYYT